MTFRFQRLSPILAVLMLFSALSAQEGGRGVKSPAELRKARQELSDKEIGENKGGKWANMTPEERLNASIRRDAKGHCRFVAACRPAKLMPGESGTLLISAILQGSAVLPAPLQMTMTPRVPAESLAVGDMIVQPAEPGVLAKGYLGRPVYENTAIIEVPVTMGSSAQIGSKQSFAVDLQFDIYDGTSTQIVGRFLERVSTEIEVGQHIDPAVAGRSNQSNGRGEQPEPADKGAQEPVSVTPPATPSEGSAALSGAAASVAGGENAPAKTPATTVEDDQGTLPPPVPTQNSYLLFAAIGLPMLILVILILMRRKP
jgi:hypothetical protein